jgi:LuxR family transcriptional regulator, maltose regulon positive regulatory protein
MLHIPESKIAVPALPDPFVPRRELLAALVGDDPADERVILVCAPGGYGKTALLAHWALAAGTAGPGLAWVNLDRGDDDPRRLWTGVLAARTPGPAGDDGWSARPGHSLGGGIGGADVRRRPP